MLYSDLIQRTKALSEGRHTVYELKEGCIEIDNVGIRHAHLSHRPEFRVLLRVDGRELIPRHSDFLSDYLLKVETRPELRLPLTEACEHVCAGADPLEQIEHRRLPLRFSEFSEATWHMQTSMYATGGLPTAILLGGLQVLLRVYELNESLPKPPDAFRQAFISLEKGTSLLEVATKLRPQVMPGKRYYDRLMR